MLQMQEVEEAACRHAVVAAVRYRQIFEEVCEPAVAAVKGETRP